MKLNVGTFNIRLGIQEGLHAIADVVRPYELDILAVQEIGDRWTMGPEGHSTVELAQMLGMEGKFIPAIEEESGARYGTAFFTTLPIVDFQILRLPEEYDEPRKMARIELDAGEPIIVFCTHLSHIEDRESQWLAVLDTVFDQINEEFPVLLLGDLNETPDHWAIEELKIAMLDADPDDRPTFPAHEPERRIDYIFVSHDTVSRAIIDDNPIASDHRLVTSEWSF